MSNDVFVGLDKQIRRGQTWNTMRDMMHLLCRMRVINERTLFEVKGGVSKSMAEGMYDEY